MFVGIAFGLGYLTFFLNSQSVLNFVWIIIFCPLVDLLVLTPHGRYVDVEIKLVPNQTFDILGIWQIF